MLAKISSKQATDSPEQKRKVALLGSTGSIGLSALEVLSSNNADYQIFGLAARKNITLFLDQLKEYTPAQAVLGSKTAYDQLISQTGSVSLNGTRLLHGPESIAELAADGQVDIVLAAIVGFDCLQPVVSAIEADKQVALANKESIVCAGSFLKKLLEKSKASIVPVDSEHSAIFQALQGERHSDIAHLTLTASGGPFLNLSPSQLKQITPDQAVKHPRWNMGAKISIDSATMMNKALELIEAYWLFGVEAERIKVVIHPQSIIHSLVAFVDGSCLAQLSVPDMKGPIAYALAYPNKRMSAVMPTLELEQIKALEFLKLDDNRFPAVSLARQCLLRGGAMPAVLNLANERAVALFLKGAITFDRIVPFVEEALSKWDGVQYATLQDLYELREQIFAEIDGS